MLEKLANVCRALASESKLLIVHILSRKTELPATDIARETDMTKPMVSNHLKQLVALGLASPRRSGAHVFYSLGVHQPSQQTFDPLPLVRLALNDAKWASKGWETTELVHLSSETATQLSPVTAHVLDIVFDAATAFGNVRRLQILRLLGSSGARTATEIRQELSMSASAVDRHLEKLWRRGYVRQEGGVWRLRKDAKTPFHAKLWALVRSALETTSRSS